MLVGSGYGMPTSSVPASAFSTACSATVVSPSEVFGRFGTLVSNPEVWAQTVFLVIYDENGGFFDHVAPPAAPAGTAGEWLTVSPLPSAAAGIAGPVGLGFRTPCLVVSPYSRGGFLSSGTFDHTSTLRLIETRFGVEVPNLLAWRRTVTGDLTGALALCRPPQARVPSLPASNSMPSQERKPPRPPVP